MKRRILQQQPTFTTRRPLSSTTTKSKTALVCGVLNHRSIGWHITKSLLDRHYNVLMTCQSDKIKQKICVNLIEPELSSRKSGKQDAVKLGCVTCDVSSDADIERLFQQHLEDFLSSTTDDLPPQKINALIHSIAYAPPSAMKPPSSQKYPLLHTTREDFHTTMNISVYSLLRMSQNAQPFLHSGGSITTLSYLGSQRAVPHYNIMGPAKAALESCVRGLALELRQDKIRVNCISSGPIATVAAKGGISNFSKMLKDVSEKSPLGRNVTVEEVGEMVAAVATGECGFSAVTGSTIYCDGGYSTIM